MSVEGLVRNARLMLRADGIAADIHLRLLLIRSGLQIAAGVVGLAGLLALGAAAFLALQALVGTVLAATIAGAGGLVLAGLLTLLAGSLHPGRELDLAHELRDRATEALIAEARGLEGDVLGLVRTVRHPLDGALPGLVVPLATLLLKTLRRAKPDEKT
jgi:hypothetical protein